jgi:hypothetical protein
MKTRLNIHQFLQQTVDSYRVVTVEDLVSSRQSVQRSWLSCQPQMPATLYLRKDLLVLISVRGELNPSSFVWLEGLVQLKQFSDLMRT